MVGVEGDAVTLEKLLDNTDIDISNSSKGTLLHVAAEHGHLSTIELLIYKGIPLNLQDDRGHTALHRATSRGPTEIVEALVQVAAPIYAMDLQAKFCAGADEGGGQAVWERHKGDWRLIEMLM